MKNFNRSKILINDANNRNYDFKLDHNAFSTWVLAFQIIDTLFALIVELFSLIKSENELESHKGLDMTDFKRNGLVDSSKYLPDFKRALPDSVGEKR